MVARTPFEADTMIIMDMCPMCNEELIVKKYREKHNDNAYYEEVTVEKVCPHCGNIDDIMNKIDFKDDNMEE